MPEFTTDQLADELFSELLLQNGKGFTRTKQLGRVQGQHNAAALIENAAAVRGLADRYPDLHITYPCTVLSEAENISRTDAVISVPDSFAELHCGIAFQQLMQEKYQQQFEELTAQIVSRLRRHEFKTNRLFGVNPLAGAASFRITEETAESDIWTVLLENCGLYPLQWDSEVCGMALLLRETLPAALAEDGREILEIAVQRMPSEKSCALTVYYSMKQD